LRSTLTEQVPDRDGKGPRHPLLKYNATSLHDLGNAANAGHLFAVLDACGCDEILTRVVNQPLDLARCLYIESAFQEHWAVAPYLVKLDLAGLSWIDENVWDEPWGILAISTQGFLRLFNHLRRNLIVKDSDGHAWIFRFYDPRVLESFLPTCDVGQLSKIYGPISHFGIKGSPAGAFTLVGRSTQQFGVNARLISAP
jgi:hypothetical protein